MEIPFSKGGDTNFTYPILKNIFEFF